MKIEKVNDNQIRCTLTREDLEERDLKISEIAYGSDKAKLLFKDVMQQANYEYGFEADNIPLMIEAIPMSTGCVMFIITKVEDPEELDTRFSRFAPSVQDEFDSDDYDDNDAIEDNQQFSSDIFDSMPEAAENVFNLFKQITNKAREAAEEKKKSNGPSPNNMKNAGPMGPAGDNNHGGPGGPMEGPYGPANQNKQSENMKKQAKMLAALRLYSFADIDTLAVACKVLNKIYKGESTLYKNPADGKYYLLLVRGLSDEKDFLKVSNLLMEYGSPETTSSASVAYIQEHYDLLVADNAVASISLI